MTYSMEEIRKLVQSIAGMARLDMRSTEQQEAQRVTLTENLDPLVDEISESVQDSLEQGFYDTSSDPSNSGKQKGLNPQADLFTPPQENATESSSSNDQVSTNMAIQTPQQSTRLAPHIYDAEQLKGLEQDMQYLGDFDIENKNKLEEEARGAPIFTGEVMARIPALYPQYGLLGRTLSTIAPLANGQTASGEMITDSRVMLNVAAPWSAFICGVQGSGKSHSLSCILENCLLESSVTKISNPLSGIIFHWDRFSGASNHQICEAATLASKGIPVRVLVSPSNYLAMKHAYENIPGLNSFQKPTVMPLLFNDKQLNASRMLTLMGVHMDNEHPPLYLEVLLRILREMAQAANTIAETSGLPNQGLNYGEFRWKLAVEGFTEAQTGPLKLRLDLLESFLRSTSGAKFDPPPYEPRQSTHQNGNRTFRDPTKDIKPLKKLSMLEERELKECWTFKPGTLTIVDLSCPFVDQNAACSLFTMCLQLYLEQDYTSGRIIALDEAHKFLTEASGAKAFTEELLHVIRMQRHYAARVVIATQEPTLSPRLLDLCNFTLVHRFQSPEWYKILKSHLAGAWNDEDVDPEQKRANNALLKTILNLQLGQALLFAPSALIGFELTSDSKSVKSVKLGMQSLHMSIRQRLSRDGGRSVFA